jgi:hypothetical protein
MKRTLLGLLFVVALSLASTNCFGSVSTGEPPGYTAIHKAQAATIYNEITTGPAICLQTVSVTAPYEVSERGNTTICIAVRENANYQYGYYPDHPAWQSLCKINIAKNTCYNSQLLPIERKYLTGYSKRLSKI